jgi:hypothetical protein
VNVSVRHKPWAKEPCGRDCNERGVYSVRLAGEETADHACYEHLAEAIASIFHRLANTPRRAWCGDCRRMHETPICSTPPRLRIATVSGT